jgi:hypothetical protein
MVNKYLRNDKIQGMTSENTKQNALNSKSVVESSIAFVISSVGILIAVFAIGTFIWLIFFENGSHQKAQSNIAFYFAWGLWAALISLLWRRMLLRMRRTPDLDLSEDGLFKFQISSALCILVFWLLLSGIENDVPGFFFAFRLIFEVVLALFTFVYLSFAWGTRKHVPVKIYWGLLINMAVIVAARLG